MISVVFLVCDGVYDTSKLQHECLRPPSLSPSMSANPFASSTHAGEAVISDDTLLVTAAICPTAF